MSKRDNARAIASSAGSGGPPAAPEPSRVAESEEWAWMVDEDPAFYLAEAGPTPDKRGG
jgi:hypothetical protein